MFRFTIRELFLFTIATAFALGWTIERRAHMASHTHAEQLRGALSVSTMNTDVYVNRINGTPLYTTTADGPGLTPEAQESPECGLAQIRQYVFSRFFSIVSH